MSHRWRGSGCDSASLLSRRGMIGALAVAPALIGKNPPACAPSLADWCAQPFHGRPVFAKTVNEQAPAVILLHEVNGLSKGCIDFGNDLVRSGFRVYMPLLFGHWRQDDIFLGYFESCLGQFSCTSVAPAHESRIAGWIRDFANDIGQRPSSEKGIAVIGMCLSGGIPLCVLPQEKVRAAIMSQPALPFGGSREKQRSVGLSQSTMDAALNAKKPIRAFRFSEDTICTAERFSFLRDYFGTQFDATEFPHPAGYRHTVFSNLTHRLHAVLTGDFGDVTRQARQMAFAFLHQHLG